MPGTVMGTENTVVSETSFCCHGIYFVVDKMDSKQRFNYLMHVTSLS